MTNGAVIYEGPSLLNGDPIVAVLTGLLLPSGNEKTGPMLQAWVIRSDMPVTEAVRSGADAAICGDCRHRSGSNVGRSCYVVWWFGPNNVYRALPKYARRSVADLALRLRTQAVRMTAYGDPAAVPSSIWLELASYARMWTGYTHHWRTCDQQLRSVLMASVDTEPEKREAQKRGWRTFRCRPVGAPLLKDEVICPASHEGDYSTTCDKCTLCSGLHRNAKSVAIRVHGAQASNFLQVPA